MVRSRPRSGRLHSGRLLALEIPPTNDLWLGRHNRPDSLYLLHPRPAFSFAGDDTTRHTVPEDDDGFRLEPVPAARVDADFFYIGLADVSIQFEVKNKVFMSFPFWQNWKEE